MRRLDIATIGRPDPDHSYSRMRAAASLVAAIAGAIGLLLVGFVVVGSVSPADALWAFVGIAILLSIWATGAWWRWDSPDRRNPHHERERRGF